MSNTNEVIITDSNYQDFINPTVDGEVKLCSSRPRSAPFGSLPFAKPYSGPTMTETQIKEKAKFLKENKSRNSDILRKYLKALDQNGTNFCWANGPTNCVRGQRLINNDTNPYEDLSPASVACPINGFRNQGGWGTEAMERIVSHGISPTRLWPNNAIDRKYFTEEAKTEALKYRVVEWEDLPPRDFLTMCTRLVNGFLVAIGLNWWSHEVVACDVEDDMTIRIWNSWGGTWSDNGFGILTRSKATPDDAVCAYTTLIAT